MYIDRLELLDSPNFQRHGWNPPVTVVVSHMPGTVWLQSGISAVVWDSEIVEIGGPQKTTSYKSGETHSTNLMMPKR